jgi:hypothetical protein
LAPLNKSQTCHDIAQTARRQEGFLDLIYKLPYKCSLFNLLEGLINLSVTSKKSEKIVVKPLDARFRLPPLKLMTTSKGPGATIATQQALLETEDKGG